MYLNHTSINTLLEKVGGTAMNTNVKYWASTVSSNDGVWCVSFLNGQVSGFAVTNPKSVRLIREL